MTVQDQIGRSRPSSILTGGNELSLAAGLRSLSNAIQLKDQSSSGADYSPKVRKPYTITKQRERWTDDEHKKFIEALKLYGRAWRRIEEHVGTKTAVQIRSHAQKFFSKVVRDSSGRSSELIEIPPPRPKRKPTHPYPRKLADPLTNTKFSKDDESQRRSLSPNSSVSEEEQQSPTSVLSTVGSRSIALSLIEEIGSLSPPLVADPMAVASILNEKLELFPDLCRRVSKDEEAKEPSSCPRSFKLFGTTLLISNAEDSASNIKDVNEQKPMEMFPQLNHGNTNSRTDPEHGISDLGSELKIRPVSVLGSKVRFGHHEDFSRGFVPYKRFAAEKKR